MTKWPDGVLVTVPGPWRDRSELVRAIAKSNMDEAIFAGALLMDVEHNRFAELWIFDADPELEQSMRLGSGNAFDPATLAAIADHGLAATLVVDGAREGLAERLSFFTEALRKAGGHGVKLEKSGVSHPWERWRKLLDAGDPQSLYFALMVQVRWEDRLTVFGMSQLGLADASFPPQSDGGAPHLLAQFNLYQWLEQPRLQTGHTFSLSEDAPRFRLELVHDDRYPGNEVLTNPQGIWLATPA